MSTNENLSEYLGEDHKPSAEELLIQNLSVRDREELNIRFSYHTPKDGQVEAYQDIRKTAKNFAALLYTLCPDSRERSLAITHLEEAVMWANAAIARRS